MGSWLLVALAPVLASQVTPVPRASLTGVIRDGESREPLSGALVVLTDLGRSAISDRVGRYTIASVASGPQHVSVRRIGYAARTLHALVPRHGTLEIDIALERVPHVLAAVDVRPLVELRGTADEDDTSYPDRGVSLAAVRNHPLLAEPDVFLAASGGEIVMRPESPAGVHVRGGAADQTSYLLDGIPVFQPYHANGTFSAWNPDALARTVVHTAAASPALGEALAGIVSGTTRSPGRRVEMHASASSAQARLTMDGPIGSGGAGFLLAARSSLPGSLMQPGEASYVRGAAADVIAKMEGPLFGGRARALVYASDDALDIAADANPPHGEPAARHEFGWGSRSTGAEWLRRADAWTIRTIVWEAVGAAQGTWHDQDGATVELTARRRDVGLLASIEHTSPGASTLGGARIEGSRTSYVTRARGGGARTSRHAWTPVVTGFVEHRRSLHPALSANAALSASILESSLHAGPRLRLRWTPSDRLALTAGHDRSHQFAQSLRNPESVVSVVFPADPVVGAGAHDIPVAHGTRSVVAAELRPVAGVRLGAQAWVRHFDDVVLVPPSTGEPFATGQLARGSGDARGASLELSASSARYGVVASWGLQRVRLRHDGGSYIPEYAAGQVAEAGVIVFPAATSSVRVGVTGAFARRSTPVSGALEWEACNLLDWGCEFGGSPRSDAGALGAVRLPAYVRIDVGIRKHWHVRLRGRDAIVAVFGTVTNVFDRGNALAMSTDPATGELVVIGMRPVAPLVAGVDWRF